MAALREAIRELRTEIEIDAPPERVWDVLTDFGAYPEWNEFITSIKGEPTVGSRLLVHIEPRARHDIQADGAGGRACA